MENNFEIKEEAEYKQEGYSVKDIISRHIRKISDICCQEFTGGYWEKIPMKTQSGVMFTEKYHQDVRESYCNAVDFLIDVLYPSGDKKFKEYIDGNENKEFTSEQIKEKIKSKRNTFKEINLMFERTNFWNKSDSSDE